jgi:hypothetical protein
VHANSIMLRELVERAISVKARVVTADLRETTSTGIHSGPGAARTMAIRSAMRSSVGSTSLGGTEMRSVLA